MAWSTSQPHLPVLWHCPRILIGNIYKIQQIIPEISKLQSRIYILRVTRPQSARRPSILQWLKFSPTTLISLKREGELEYNFPAQLAEVESTLINNPIVGMQY